MAESQEIINSLEQISKSLKGVDGLTREYSATLTKATSEMLNKSKMLATGVKKTSSAYLESNERIKALVKQMAQLKAQSREVYEAQQKLEKSAERISKGYGAWAESIEKVYGQTKNALGTMGQYGSILGVQSLGVKTITDRYVKYSQSLFSLSRIQQTAGRGTKDLRQAFETVGQKTILAKDQFAGLASEISNTVTGLAPATSSIADMAAVMQNKFGPNIDLIIAKTKEFYQIQSAWPDLAKEIETATKAVTESERQRAEVMALSMMRQKGYSAEQIKYATQVMAKTTPEQQKQVDLAEQLGKSFQESGNLQLAVAEEMKDSIIGLSRAVEKLTKGLGEVPGVLASISGAIPSISMLGGLGAGVLLGKGMKALTKKTIAGAGASAMSGLGGAVSGGVISGGIKNLPYEITSKTLSAMRKGAGPFAQEAGKTIGKEAFRVDLASAAGDVLAKTTGTSLIRVLGAAGIAGAIGGAIIAAVKMYENKQYKEGSEIEEASKLKTSGKQKFGRKYSEEMVKAGGFVSGEAVEAKKFISIHQEVYDRLLAEQEATKGIVSETSKINTQYQAVISNQESWLENYGKGLSAASELADMGERLLVADTAAAEAQQYFARASRDVTNQTAKETLNLVKQNLLRENIVISTDESLSVEKQMEQALQKINEKIKTSVSGSSQEGSLLSANRDIIDQTSLMRSQDVKNVDALMNRMTKQLNISQSINNIYEERYGIERQLMETAQFGLGASVEMMQKQVDLFNRRIDANKEALDLLEKEWVASNKITQADFERLKNARDDNELKQTAASIAKERNVNEKDLLASATKYLDITNDQMKQQQKILEITKQVREGYLSAMKQAAFGFGQFGKIIGLQQRGASQLMNLVKKVTGSRQLNTFAMGGQQSQADTQSGLGKDVSYQYSTTGVQKNISREEESRRLNRTWKYKETARMAAGGARVGTGAAASPADIAVMQQRAAGRSGGGENVKTSKGLPDLTKGTMAVEKGSVYTPGATLPGQQGIPPNYAGGENIVPFATDVTKRSRGQVANPSGGPALTPTPLKGATKEAHVSEWMKPMFEKQDATNAKLDDILVELKSGMNIRSMNITA